MTTPQVQEAIDFLIKSYGNVKQAAKSWQLNPQEVLDALNDAERGSAEHYVLTLLAEANPVTYEPKKVIPIAKDTKATKDQDDTSKE